MEPAPHHLPRSNYWLAGAFAVGMLLVASGSDESVGVMRYAAMVVGPCGIVGAFLGFPLRGLAVGFAFLAAIAALMLQGIGC